MYFSIVIRFIDYATSPHSTNNLTWNVYSVEYMYKYTILISDSSEMSFSQFVKTQFHSSLFEFSLNKSGKMGKPRKLCKFKKMLPNREKSRSVYKDKWKTLHFVPQNSEYNWIELNIYSVISCENGWHFKFIPRKMNYMNKKFNRWTSVCQWPMHVKHTLQEI